MNKTGLIVKAIAGFYYVAVDEVLLECKARGLFRNENITPLVGDTAEVETQGEKGLVVGIHPRKNEFTRPPMANLDCLVIVLSVVAPLPNLQVIDKLITVCEYKGIDPVLVITKTDLSDIGALEEIYRTAGFPVISLSNLGHTGFDMVKAHLRGRISAFAGNTGVGKSSLLNNIFPGLHLETAQVSKKLGRGRHTTRHVELFPIPEMNAYVADTPGFGSMDLAKYEVIKKEELAGCFREFRPYLGKCRFTDCSHTGEPGCALQEGLESHKIPVSRIKSYIRLYEEARQIKDWER